MKRNEHLFQFTGSAISRAASAEAKYHRDRLAWWRGEQDRCKQGAESTQS